MSLMPIESHWRCPNCKTDNQYYRNWLITYSFNEVEDVEYSKEKCCCCGKEFYVADSEPNIMVFKSMSKPNASLCKNDYIKDMVLDINLPLTIKEISGHD